MSRTKEILLLTVATISAPITWSILVSAWLYGYVFVAVVAAILWSAITDVPRFASLQPYASELTLLPAPVVSVGSEQQSHSGVIGQSYRLYIERDYTFKTLQSPQSVFSFYDSELTHRGWKEDGYSSSYVYTSSDDQDTETWQRPGTHDDTLSYSVAYYFGSGSPVNDPYPNLLVLTIASHPKPQKPLFTISPH